MQELFPSQNVTILFSNRGYLMGGERRKAVFLFEHFVVCSLSTINLWNRESRNKLIADTPWLATSLFSSHLFALILLSSEQTSVSLYPSHEKRKKRANHKIHYIYTAVHWTTPYPLPSWVGDTFNDDLCKTDHGLQDQAYHGTLSTHLSFDCLLFDNPISFTYNAKIAREIDTYETVIDR